MTKRQLTKVLNNIALPNYFTKKGTLAYYTVSEDDYDILIGVDLDRTMDADKFFVQYFIQPLFYPFETFIYTFGERIGGYWKAGEEDKIEKELSRLKRLHSFEEVADLLKAKFSGVNKEYFHQSLGFISYIKGDLESAKIEICKIANEISEDIPKWREEEIKKSMEIIELINRRELEPVLKNWQKSTLKALKL